MVVKKTGWYTCISPCRLGAIAAGYTRPEGLDLLGRVFEKVGVAFQIQDDVLNLVGEESVYGKEILGDLLEGKRTLLLIHLMRWLGRGWRCGGTTRSAPTSSCTPLNRILCIKEAASSSTCSSWRT